MSAERLIRQMPLTEVWDATGVVSTMPHGLRGCEAIRTLLRASPVWFVIANVGDAPRWIPLESCYHTWKTDIRDRLVEPAVAVVHIPYEAYPGMYCYVAEEWEGIGAIPIIVLTVWH